MSTGCLLLVRFENRQKLVGAIEKLNAMEHLKQWHAVDGYFGLVLHLNGEVDSVAERIARIDGFTELARCERFDDASSLLSLADEKSHSFLFMETNPELRDSLCSQIKKLGPTIYCASTNGDYNLIAVIAGNSFDEIDRTIQETIQPLDGVLRLKQDRIISLDSF